MRLKSHILSDSVVDSSTKVMSERHSPVTTVAYPRVQLFESTLVQKTSEKSFQSLHVDFTINALSLGNGIMQIVFVFW